MVSFSEVCLSIRIILDDDFPAGAIPQPYKSAMWPILIMCNLIYIRNVWFTGGLFIAIVGTFRFKTRCDVLEKFFVMHDTFEKIRGMSYYHLSHLSNEFLKILRSRVDIIL